MKVEPSLNIKTEPPENPTASTTDVLKKEKDLEQIRVVRSLSEHSPTCQLRLSLESSKNDQASNKVMQCCTNESDSTLSLNVATAGHATE